MAEIVTHKCDECGINKQPSNGWWVTRIGAMTILTDDNENYWVEPRAFVVVQMGVDYESIEGDWHLCGKECVQKTLEKHLHQLEKKSHTGDTRSVGSE